MTPLINTNSKKVLGLICFTILLLITIITITKTEKYYENY